MSPLEQALTDYLQLRRSLGHELAEAGWLLPGFVAYLDAHGSRTVTIEGALGWAQQSPTGRVTTVGPRRMTAVRGFARYLAGIEAATEVPPLGLMPHRARWRRPFIYSAADIDAVMEQARRSIVSPLRAATYHTLIGLLAASGLRIGEAIKLDRSDVDWAQGVLLIRESKFGKSRLVPLHPSSMPALDGSAQLRDQLQPRPTEPAFFVSLKRKRLLYAVVQQTFRRLVDNAGVGVGSPSAPRLHDLRHTFAVCTLLGWYRANEDVQAKLPWLSTYLGHREPASTYWYLSAAPELLALAAARQDTAWSAAHS
ncbi:tyrosine-type recombinase/integrase [soil metagenome]